MSYKPMKNNPVSQTSSLESIRFDRMGIKAPSPVSAGLGLIRMGASLMVQPVLSPVRKRFVRVERHLVVLFTGHYNYNREHARIAWTAAGMIGGVAVLASASLVVMALYWLGK
jgi:hypothetical protein